MRGAPPYDHIVIETTGIAEPKAIRANFQAAEDYGACEGWLRMWCMRGWDQAGGV